MADMFIIKELSPEKPQLGKPSAADLAAINRFALEPLGDEDVFVTTMHLANDQIDRSRERFSIEYLTRFAETAPGKPVLIGHKKDSEPVGKFFAADVVPQVDGSHHLVTRAYMLAGDERVSRVKAGILRDVSIGARVDKRTCSLCEKDYDTDCAHNVRKVYDGKQPVLTWTGDLSKVEMMEGSFVYVAAQHGAQTVAAHAPAGYLIKEAVPGGSQILDYGARDETAPQEENVDELKAALEKIAALEEENGRLKPMAEEGERARTAAIAEVQRKYGSLKLEKTGESICKSLSGASLEAIGAADKEAQALYDEKFPPQSMGSARDLTKSEDAPPPRRFDPLGTNPFRRSA